MVANSFIIAGHAVISALSVSAGGWGGGGLPGGGGGGREGGVQRFQILWNLKGDWTKTTSRLGSRLQFSLPVLPSNL